MNKLACQLELAEEELNSSTLSPDPEGMLPLRVARKTRIATDIFLFELLRTDGQVLPPFSAGAHITVLTPNGLTRRYSLCNGPGETNFYRIAIKRDIHGMGGSINLTDHVQEGDVLPASVPLNYFALDHQARTHLLIAGGIGITPIMSMVRELQARHMDFRVIYVTRTPESAAFREELNTPELGGRVLIHHNHGNPSHSLDLVPLLANHPEGGHVYCCGPRRLMQAVREYTHHWPSGSVHFEDFGTSVQPQTPEDRPFAVKLLRSGVTIEVPCGVSILEALRRENISVPSSCESGTCGACRTPLISGVAQHRDYVLDEDQHDKEIMICVSRAVSPLLEIEL